VENTENNVTPEEVVAKFEAKINEKTESLVSKNEMEDLKNELSSIKKLAETDNTVELKAKFVELESSLEGLKESSKETKTKGMGLTDLIKSKGNDIKKMISEKKGAITLDIKSQQNPSDIGQRDDYAQFLDGTINKPTRAIRIVDLFRRVPVSTEYVKYREQNTVTRDGSVVVACATSTSETKLTWINRTVQIQKIRDFVDVCIDMMDDYSFVASQVEDLVNSSVKLKEESEILLGTVIFYLLMQLHLYLILQMF
jgi:hypothetical protein